jgi:hypothetical protein
MTAIETTRIAAFLVAGDQAATADAQGQALGACIL